MYYDFHKILAEATIATWRRRRAVEPRLWQGGGAGRAKEAKATSAQFKGAPPLILAPTPLPRVNT